LKDIDESPVVANICMEKIEEMAIETTPMQNWFSKAITRRNRTES
jgi:hypothetical protein